MKKFLSKFFQDESGASAAEYALILAVVGVAIGAAALTLGQNVGLSINKSAVTVGKCGSKANGTAATAYKTTVPADCN
ncbi:Flp family type IVb pilin [Novosphingobium sp. Gsoil 351]|uniref:Flp family type IVb pilin n=1 Tax=Novosphingobium sp. Gsoil 351 TaxID=2675225 RepID=UPI0012B490E3|nr:Flp family type IVb pilin [Novosphingobium sp. Gsoil 351]QGN54470.1 Flp family type IVb pilin [Novosphingobium sp. Gsoil 351]